MIRARQNDDSPGGQRFDRRDWPFLAGLGVIGMLYIGLLLAMMVAGLDFTSPGHLVKAMQSEEVRFAIRLGLITCSVTMVISVIVAVPIGYLLSRFSFTIRFRRVNPWIPKELSFKSLIDALLDIPIILPPLVIGLLLLILFQTTPGRWFESRFFDFTYAVPGIILAQFTVACAFSVRTMRANFEQIPHRREQVALTLGCTRWQAFVRVVLPEARRGILTAATLAWARSLGEFGPILVFAGATRMRTEVPATTVFLELSVGNIEAAVAVSLLMIASAILVLVLIRVFGFDPSLREVR